MKTLQALNNQLQAFRKERVLSQATYIKIAEDNIVTAIRNVLAARNDSYHVSQKVLVSYRVFWKRIISFVATNIATKRKLSHEGSVPILSVQFNLFQRFN